MGEQETKSFITEKAFKLFLGKGYKNTSMQDLVAETNLSKGAFYHYFRNKEKIYEEVIDTYFITYYNQVDWNTVEKMDLGEIENVMQEFYKSFVPAILSTTQKGMSRYFMLFFEAFEIHPTFKNDVQGFYKKLRQVLTQAFKKEKSKNPSLDALHSIAKFEGMLFWLAVFPEQNPENY